MNIRRTGFISRFSSIVTGLVCLLFVFPPGSVLSENVQESPPLLELILGAIPPFAGSSPKDDVPNDASTNQAQIEHDNFPADSAPAATPEEREPEKLPDLADLVRKNRGTAMAGLKEPSIVLDPGEKQQPDYRFSSYNVFALKNIPPLYVTPVLPGEGIWRSDEMPSGPGGRPVIYKTSYRPSVEFPNAVVYMLFFDMKQLAMRLYIGSTEPGGSAGSASIEPNLRPDLLAVTNALWKQKHSGEAGAVNKGNVLKALVPGMATIVIYVDGSVDVMEWNDGIPMELVQDARQLRHLIVKDGKVVDSVIKGGKESDSEIGLGFLLSEEQPQEQQQYWWNGFGGSNSTSGPNWFIATRSAFGIRKDGNLVFAAGYHISTKDLAKALVLAGCERAIHGDANPHNVLANLYYREGDGSEKRAKLSPEQRNTLDRYDRGYTSDFFGFFIKNERNSS